MKIVIVDTTLSGTVIGGAQTFLPLLVNGLVNNSHEVYVVSDGAPSEKIKTQLETSGAQIYPSIWKKGLIPEDAAKQLAEWVNERNPDVYVISVSPAIGWLALPLLKSSIATLTIGHTDSDTFYKPARHYNSFLTETIGVSDQVTERYASKSGIPAAQISRIPYGVTVAAAAPKENDENSIRLIYVGRLEEEQKRVSDLAAIALELDRAGVSFHLTIVGDGPEMPVMQSSLQLLVEKKMVEFTGWEVNAKIIERLRDAEVFVLTSAYEGFCIALVEAMANGCCPVVTNIDSGNKQLITDQQNGFLLPIGDRHAFVQTITGLQNDKQRLFALRTAAWEEGRKYSVAAMVKAYEDSFIKAVDTNSTNKRKEVTDFPVMESCRSSYPRWARRLKAKLFS